MTIIGIRVDYGEAYEDLFVDVNQDDYDFWDYYKDMRTKNDEFVEDYTRSNIFYPKLRNFINISNVNYDELDDIHKLSASCFWI